MCLTLSVVILDITSNFKKRFLPFTANVQALAVTS